MTVSAFVGYCKKSKAYICTNSVLKYHTTRKQSQLDPVKEGNEAETGKLPQI
jgi:hypothetical protein